MGVFKRFERRLEGAVGNAFARVFGGKIVPAEVEDALQREADLAVRDVDGYPLVPNRYILTVSEADLTNLTADTDLGLKAFARHLDGYIADQGWQAYGEIAVELESSGSLHTGQFRTHSAFDPDGGAQPAPMPAPSRPGAAPMADDPSSPRPSTPRPAAPQGRPDPGPQAAPPPRDPYGQYPPAEQGHRSPPPPPARPYDDGPVAPHPGPAAYGPGEPHPGYQDRPQPQQPYDERGYRAPDRGRGVPDYDYDYDYGGADHGEYPRSAPQYPPQQPAYPAPGDRYGRPEPAGEPYGRSERYAAQYPADPYDQAAPPARPAPGHADQPGYGDRAGYPEHQGYPEQPGQADPGYGDRPYPAPTGERPGYGEPVYTPPVGYTVSLQLQDGSGRSLTLAHGSNVIGRGQDAQFRIPDTGVSRRHIDVQWDGSVALLVDLQSTNGTTVNGTPVQEWQLADRDVIRVGHSELVVYVH